MNEQPAAPFRFEINGLVQAIAQSNVGEALRSQFNQLYWEILASYMQPFALTNGQVLMEQGAPDNTFYLIESGTLSVYYQNEKSRIRMALVVARTVLDEGAFFLRVSPQCNCACLKSVQTLVPQLDALPGTRHPPQPHSAEVDHGHIRGYGKNALQPPQTCSGGLTFMGLSLLRALSGTLHTHPLSAFKPFLVRQ